MGLEEVRFDMAAVRRPSAAAIAAAIGSEIDRMREMFRVLTDRGFDADFVRQFDVNKEDWLSVWDEEWQVRCNGKQLLEDLRKAGHFKGDLLKLKKAVVARMRTDGADVYKSLDRMLRLLLGSP